MVVIDPDGSCRFFKDSAKPLQPGQVALRVSLEQPMEGLTPAQLDALKEQLVEVFPGTCSGDRRDTDSEDAVSAFLEELDNVSFEDLRSSSCAVARWTVQQWTAQARFFLGTLTDSHPMWSDVQVGVKRLTWLANQLQTTGQAIGFINGLERRAEADWKSVMVHARSQLASAKAHEKQGGDQHQAPKRDPSGRTETTSNRESPPLFPRLQQKMKLGGARVLIVGGVRRPERLQYFSRLLGQNGYDWPDLEGTAARSLGNYEHRIRNGSVVCVLILQELFSHASGDRIVKACKTSGVPFRTANKGTPGRVEAALASIEGEL